MVAVVALVGAACGDDDDEASTTETTADADDGGAAEEEFDGVVFTATEYEFDAPDEMHASTVNIRAVNDGAVAHEFALVKLGDDQSREDFFEEFDAFVAADFSGPLPTTLSNGFVAPGGGNVQPGGDPIEAEISMSEGNWVLFCALTDGDTESDEEEGGGGGGDEPSGRAQDEEEGGGGEGGEEEAPLPPHYQSGMFKEITVTGDAEPTVPNGTAITAVDYSFEGLDALTDDTNDVVFANSAESENLHHLVVTDFGTDLTAKDAESKFAECLAFFFASEDGGGGGTEEPAGRAQDEGEEEGGGPPPGCDNEDVGEAFVMAPGYGTTFDISFEAGHTYVFTCFIGDVEGGPPHAVANDMFKAFTIA
ncbi:MAG TPA: hypothetical protein VI916_10750 [Acidimicrobiia bacterium]|nr:hypothetical protein [Acidimicrobiia bacterium]